MTRDKKLFGLNSLPEVQRGILAGIAIELMEVNPALRAIFHKGMGNTRRAYYLTAEQAAKTYGVYIKLRKVVVIHIAFYDGIAHAAYEWKGKLIPSRPIPTRPGWVYRGRRDDTWDDWRVDIQDPSEFKDWMERAVKLVKERVNYLEDRRLQLAANRELVTRQATITAERRRQSEERWKRIETDMYVI